MVFNLFALAGELRNMIYEQHLQDDFNAPGWFNGEIQQARLPVPDLAVAYPPLHQEIISYFYGGMFVEMDIKNNTQFWYNWAGSDNVDSVLAELRKFEIRGPDICDGVAHGKIFVDLINENNPVTYGTQLPGRKIEKNEDCKCETGQGGYRNAAQSISQIVRCGYEGGKLVLTAAKLEEILDVVIGIKRQNDKADKTDLQ